MTCWPREFAKDTLRGLSAVAVLCLIIFLGGAPTLMAQSSGTVPGGASAVLPGTYAVSTLPAAAGNQGRYAFVTDLGGGADMVLSDGANWKHIRQGVITNVPIASTIAVTPLASPPIMQLTGSGFTGASAVTISTTNLYPGYTLHIVVPSGVLSTVTGLLGSIGVGVAGTAALPLVGGTWEDVQWNGTMLVELGRGTL